MKKNAFIERLSCTYDPRLDDEEKNNPNPFPEKMALAIATIEQYGLPNHIMYPKKQKQPTLSPLQAELLAVYENIEPTDMQMLELKAFLQQLFGEQLARKEEMAA
jgi:hypothetical protein